MKFRILLDNYYSYIIIFGAISIVAYFFLDEKFSYTTLLIFTLLWLTDLIFEKKRYLKSIEINQTHLKISYLNIFLQEKNYTKEIELIEHTNYKKSESAFNKFDLLFIREKDDSETFKFKIFDSLTKENVLKKVNQLQNKSSC